MGTKRASLYVGICVAGALVILGAMLISFSKQKAYGNTYPIYAVFNFISGIIKGAPVRYAGVDVGNVLDTIIFEDKNGKIRVKLKLAINRNIRIRKDSLVFINSLGIIGEKYVEISPGSSKEYLQAGETLYGTDPVAIEHTLVKAEIALEKLNTILSSINAILTTETQTDIKTTITNLRKFSDRIHILTKKSESIIDRINRKEGTLGKLIYTQELYDELLNLIKNWRRYGILYKEKSGIRKHPAKISPRKRR